MQVNDECPIESAENTQDSEGNNFEEMPIPAVSDREEYQLVGSERIHSL